MTDLATRPTIPLGPCPDCGRPMTTRDPADAAFWERVGAAPRCTPCCLAIAGR